MSSSLVETEVAGMAIQNNDESVALVKEERLRELFREMKTAVVAFSGGVDSTYLAFIANKELRQNALCITGESASLSISQREQTIRLAQQLDLNREVVVTEEMDDANYTRNDSSRCYFCKDELFNKLKNIAAHRGIASIVDGSTCDDLTDYRPGRQAMSKHNIRSPLIEVGMSKAEVRLLSRRAELPTWNQPASPCLSSRIAYGVPVTIARLSTVDRGEQIMRDLGFREFRVRHHDNLVRLEISPDELPKALHADVVKELADKFRELGFQYVTLDLHGYRTGALNEVLGSSDNKVLVTN